MAAYAALVSLMNVMYNIQNHPRVSSFLDKEQTRSLCESVDFLLHFVESQERGVSKQKLQDLERQITLAAHEAEDVIESHIVDRIVAEESMETNKSPFDFSHLSCFVGLQKVIHGMDSIKENVDKFREERVSKQDPTNSTSTASRAPAMVGFDGYLLQLLDWLTAGQQSNRRIISITGMGGIGKTALAKAVYQHSLIVQHFDVCAWATVSQQYDVTKILSEILSCLPVSISDMKTKDQLGEQLHKVLFGRRYLIVLDDMWSIEAWDNIKFFFPQNDNTSRIVVTTRQSGMANHCGSLALAMDFLDDDRSWHLFCLNTFGLEDCPPELEEIGKKIVKRGKGLPLAIVVIGGLLRKSSRIKEYWETVETDLTSILNSVEDNHCLNILSLSYSYLPAYLKPCFLYLGTFPEDHKIRVSRLVKLWVAEGFVKPHTEQRLEEVAEGYVKDLVDRNLLLVQGLRWNGKCKAFGIHDLLRDLCINVAEKANFFYVMREFDTPREMCRERRIIIHENISRKGWGIGYDIEVSLKSVRSIIGNHHCELLSKPKLLRVMPDKDVLLFTSFQQVNSRFLENFCVVPKSISLLWNLQTLILTEDDPFIAPSEIWEMPQLRHVVSRSIILPDPPQSDKLDIIVLRNLQTLGHVEKFRCSEEVYKRMPNIRKLHISADCYVGGEDHDLSYYCHHNLACLNKLEVLLYELRYQIIPGDLVHNIRFPSSLKKLTLEGCCFYWDDLRMIGSLPCLEFLRLGSGSVEGPEWNPVDGEFLRLKYLQISWCTDLEDWNADASHFPVLEVLFVEGLWRLNEIPLSIGEIPTLGSIYMQSCSVSAAVSAMEIVKEQEDLGNEDLQVRVNFWYNREAEEEFMEKMGEEGFAEPCFQVIRKSNYHFSP